MAALFLGTSLQSSPRIIRIGRRCFFREVNVRSFPPSRSGCGHPTRFCFLRFLKVPRDCLPFLHQESVLSCLQHTAAVADGSAPCRNGNYEFRGNNFDPVFVLLHVISNMLIVSFRASVWHSEPDHILVPLEPRLFVSLRCVVPAFNWFSTGPHFLGFTTGFTRSRACAIFCCTVVRVHGRVNV